MTMASNNSNNVSIRVNIAASQGGDSQAAGAPKTGNSMAMPPLPKWEELVPANQPPPPPSSASGNIIYNYYQPSSEHSNPATATRQLMPGMPVAGGRFVSTTGRPPVAVRPPPVDPGQLRLIPVMLTRTVVHWLRPISKHCTQDNFFRSINETMFMEALGLFSVFYFNRPPNRASISMLQLFRMVMEMGGYHEVCDRKLWATLANAMVKQTGSQVDLTVAQQALCSLYRINLLPFEEFHFRSTRAESLPGIDLNVLRGRTDQWKGFIMQQQQHMQTQAAHAPPVIAPQPSPQSQSVQPPRPAAPQTMPSPSHHQQQPKRLPELLRMIGEKRTSPTRLQDISGVSLHYLEKCYRAGGEAQRTFVWNSLLPLVANGKMTSSDAGPLQYLAIQLEGELSTFLSGNQQHLQRISELDFVHYVGNVELLHEPNAKVEQLVLLLSCLVNIGNFAVFFSKRPQTVRIMEAFLLRANFLTVESWERLLEAFEIVQRFCKALSPPFLKLFTELACEDVRHSVEMMASRSVLSLQLGDVGKQDEVSAFPFNILPRRTFFLLSILHARITQDDDKGGLERTLLKLLGATYYKIQRQVGSKQQKLKKEGTATLQQRLMTAVLEDYGYVELCLMILSKLEIAGEGGVLLRMFSLLWDFWMSFSTLKQQSGGGSGPQLESMVHFSALHRLTKLLAPMIEPRELDIAQWLIDYSSLPKTSVARFILDPVADTLVGKISSTLAIGAEPLEFDWREKAQIDLVLEGIASEHSDWASFQRDFFGTNVNTAELIFKGEDGGIPVIIKE